MAVAKLQRKREQTTDGPINGRRQTQTPGMGLLPRMPSSCGSGVPGRTVERRSLTVKMRRVRLPQLKKLLEAIWSSKTINDRHGREQRTPISTLQQYMYVFLLHRFGLRSVVVEYATAILQGVDEYSRVDADVLLFGKVLGCRVDEAFRNIHEELKATFGSLLEELLRLLHPLKDETQIASLMKEYRSGKRLLTGAEVLPILGHIYSDEQVKNITQGFLNAANRESLPVPANEDVGGDIPPSWWHMDVDTLLDPAIPLPARVHPNQALSFGRTAPSTPAPAGQQEPATRAGPPTVQGQETFSITLTDDTKKPESSPTGGRRMSRARISLASTADASEAPRTRGALTSSVASARHFGRPSALLVDRAHSVQSTPDVAGDKGEESEGRKGENGGEGGDTCESGGGGDGFCGLLLSYERVLSVLLAFQLHDRERRLQPLSALFRKVDWDNDGMINRRDAALLLSKHLPAVSDQQVKRCIGLMDPNKFDRITFDCLVAHTDRREDSRNQRSYLLPLGVGALGRSASSIVSLGSLDSFRHISPPWLSGAMAAAAASSSSSALPYNEAIPSPTPGRYKQGSRVLMVTSEREKGKQRWVKADVYRIEEGSGRTALHLREVGGHREEFKVLVPHSKTKTSPHGQQAHGGFRLTHKNSADQEDNTMAPRDPGDDHLSCVFSFVTPRELSALPTLSKQWPQVRKGALHQQTHIDTAIVSAAALNVVLDKCRAMYLPHNRVLKLHKASESGNTLSDLCHSLSHAIRHELPSGPLCLMIHHCDRDEPHSHVTILDSSPTTLKPPDVPPTHTLTSATVHAVMMHIKTNNPSTQLPVTSKTVKLCVAMTSDGSGRGFVSLERGGDMMLRVGSETYPRWDFADWYLYPRWYFADWYLADIETKAADDIELWAIR
ncbi:unnamed protein product [Vitrella brassicaformis CCMP3155]|uniref:EF-hand domain-containing protein n=3 Tax=Vitrella brassicaformis TaxID=1169539 RepID=A0A0G4FAH5_VITBC|nr:unnamed protein product [Vitrella brassicaformis CCMP3155]|eukprot:CEM09927.1 unnamed protein product [Vitrella brassicaformis CCMP3155]